MSLHIHQVWPLSGMAFHFHPGSPDLGPIGASLLHGNLRHQILARRLLELESSKCYRRIPSHLKYKSIFFSGEAYRVSQMKEVQGVKGRQTASFGWSDLRVSLRVSHRFVLSFGIHTIRRRGRRTASVSWLIPSFVVGLI